MNERNTAAHNLALRMIGDPSQAISSSVNRPDTPGGRLKAARHGESFLFSPSGGEVVTRLCEWECLTAHANRDDLLELVGQVEPRAVLLGGEARLAQLVRGTKPRARYPKPKSFSPSRAEL